MSFRRWSAILLVVGYIFIILSGCGTIAEKRRIEYISLHTGLSDAQKELISKGRLWVGMTQEEVLASIGKPTRKSKDFLGKREEWTYLYNDNLTGRRKYLFRRAFRLEFAEGRLADWRKD